MFARIAQTLALAAAFATVAPAPLAFAETNSIEVATVDPVDYHESIVAIDDTVTAAFDAYFDALATGTPSQMSAARHDAVAKIDAALVELRAKPTWSGDTGVKDAFVARLEFYRAAFTDDFPTVEKLLATGSSYDLETAELTLLALELEEVVYDTAIDLAQADYATKHGLSFASDAPAATSSVSSSTSSSGSSVEIDVPEYDDPTYVSLWGSLDRAGDKDWKGWSLGYETHAPRLSAGFEWRHAKVYDDGLDRFELVVKPSLVSTDFLGVSGVMAGGYAWGGGQDGWGATLGGEVTLGGTVYAFGRAGRGFWSGDVKDELSGWDLQAGVGMTLKL